MATMVFKSPGPHRIHGVDVDYVVVDETALDARLADGWTLTAVAAGEVRAAREAAEVVSREAAEQQAAATALADDAKPPTREELEAMATKLGLPFSARVSDKKLRALIEAAVARNDAQAAVEAPQGEAPQGEVAPEVATETDAQAPAETPTEAAA